jgi:hypothetical protein
MTRRALQILKVLGLLMLYVWMCREFYLFNVMDACLDGGGAYDATTRTCSRPPFGEQFDVGARASFLFWVMLLGLPGLPVIGLGKAISYAATKMRRAPPNRTVETGARKSGARGSP